MRAIQKSELPYGRIIFAALLLAVGIVAVVLAFGFGPSARQLPLVVGIPLVVLASINLVSEWRGAGSQKTDPGQESEVTGEAGPPGQERIDEAAQPDVSTAATGLPIALAFAATALFVAIYLVFGQIVASTMGIVVLLRIAKQSWLAAIVTAIVSVVPVYVISTWLAVRVHTGWIDIVGLISRLFNA